MIIIGEKLNSSIPKTLEAIKEEDKEYLLSLITSQENNGADYLDINTAICEEELDKMLWLIDLVMEHSQCGIMIDSPSVSVVKEAVKRAAGRKVIINSVTLIERIDELLPLIKETGASVVGLPMDEDGIPDTVEKRVANALRLIEKISAFGIPQENIFIDAITEVLCVNKENAMLAIETIRKVKEIHPEIKMVAGISNISFGVPKRININSAFLTATIVAGLDSAIIDINSTQMRVALSAALAVAGKDKYCLKYIKAMKKLV